VEKQKKTFLHFMIAPDLLAKVDEFRFEGRFQSRVAAIIALLGLGLNRNGDDKPRRRPMP
jgi:hypothetical protein